MIISNVKIAERIASRGYDYEDALASVDEVRTLDDEKLEISEQDIEDLVNNICTGFDCESDWRN